MYLFLWLIFAHALSDWSLQSRFVAEQKANHFIVMFMHCVVWVGCVCIVTTFFDAFEMWHVPFLFIGHAICDYGKSKLLPKITLCQDDKKAWKLVYIDQIIHLLQLGVVCL